MFLIFVFQKICLQLWCVNPETGMCTTHHEPGAEGSSCGHEKVQIIFLQPVQGRKLLEEAMSGLRSRSFCLSCQLYAFLFATEIEKLLVKNKITARCLTNVSQSLYQTLQTTEMNFEEPLGKQVFKN